MKKPFIFLAALAGLALVVWGGWHYSQRSKDQGLVFHGNVDIRQISLAFDGYGRVKALNGQEGERVKTGALLGRLDTKTTALQAEQALAQIEVQRQSLLRLRNGARPQEIAQASSRLLARQADAARAEKDLARLQSVAANTQGRGVSAQDLDRAKSAVQVAQAQIAASGSCRRRSLHSHSTTVLMSVPQAEVTACAVGGSARSSI
ncbi:MAG: biotin/lipoyl-binding protein [Comamonas sp.]|nr:biotin/lipoyl-binding protein [Comamonas sp.]